jgi:transposase
VLLAVRHGACAAKVSATNQLKALIVGAPEELRAELRGLATKRQIARCARLRDRPSRSLEHRMTVRALRSTAQRIQLLAADCWPPRPPSCGPSWSGWWPRSRHGC